MTMLIKSVFALVLVLTLTAANHVTKKENPSSANRSTSTRLINIDNVLTSELLHLSNKKSKSKEDYKRLVKLVKNPRVDVNVKDPLFLGATPLHLLFYHESNDTIPISFVKLLIKKGADINAKDDQTGAPPLFLLCWNYSGKNLNKLVKLLIEKGADVKATNSFGWRLENFPKCRSFGTESPRPNIDKALSSELLHLASKKDKSDKDYKRLVQLVENPRVDVNTKDPLFLSATPLHLLFLYESNATIPIDFIKLLIQKGANVNAKDGQTGAPPLFLMCMNYSGKNLDQIVKLLIEKGADVNATNSYGWRLVNFPKCQKFAQK